MEELAKPALNAVLSEEIEFYPGKFKNLYRHWMENIKDWCISRQLWWGQRIPAWYDEKGNIYVATNQADALEKAAAKRNLPKDTITLRQEEDVLDTWFSSWLWPMEVFNWNEDANNIDLKYYYPTNTLVTGPDIIFFWVARMVMAGYEFMDQKPFNQVYFTGIIRDKQGRKMSKSLGNSPDLLELIENFGADALRFSIMISSPAGNDLLYDESLLDQGKFFCNKMWNALKLIKTWEDRADENLTDEQAEFSIAWMESRIAATSIQLEDMYKDFRLSEALKTIYSLIWDDFCSWYLEWVKPAMDQPIANKVYQKTIDIYERLMQLLHPFLPFVTEEIYQLLRERKQGDDLIVRQLPTTMHSDDTILKKGVLLQEVISSIRDTRNKNQLKPKDTIQLWIDSNNKNFYEEIQGILKRQVNAESLAFTNEAVQGSISIVVQTDKIYIGADTAPVDKSQQKAEMQKEMDYLKGFLESVEKKLSNERFMSNAKPEVIDGERKKKADAEAKMRALQESLSLL